MCPRPRSVIVTCVLMRQVVLHGESLITVVRVVVQAGPSASLRRAAGRGTAMRHRRCRQPLQRDRQQQQPGQEHAQS